LLDALAAPFLLARRGASLLVFVAPFLLVLFAERFRLVLFAGLFLLVLFVERFRLVLFAGLFLLVLFVERFLLVLFAGLFLLVLFADPFRLVLFAFPGALALALFAELRLRVPAPGLARAFVGRLRVEVLPAAAIPGPSKPRLPAEMQGKRGVEEREDPCKEAWSENARWRRAIGSRRLTLGRSSNGCSNNASRGSAGHVR
jgi:hypothetical protein